MPRASAGALALAAPDVGAGVGLVLATRMLPRLFGHPKLAPSLILARVARSAVVLSPAGRSFCEQQGFAGLTEAEHLTFWTVAAPAYVLCRVLLSLVPQHSLRWHGLVGQLRRASAMGLLWLILPTRGASAVFSLLVPRVAKAGGLALGLGSGQLRRGRSPLSSLLFASLWDVVPLLYVPLLLVAPGFATLSGSRVLGLLSPACGSALALHSARGRPDRSVRFWLKFWCLSVPYELLRRPLLERAFFDVVPLARAAEVAALLWLQLRPTRGAEVLFDAAEVQMSALLFSSASDA